MEIIYWCHLTLCDVVNSIFPFIIYHGVASSSSINIFCYEAYVLVRLLSGTREPVIVINVSISTEFQIWVKTLIHLITENKLRYASGPVHTSIRYMYVNIYWKDLGRARLCILKIQYFVTGQIRTDQIFDRECNCPHVWVTLIIVKCLMFNMGEHLQK